jgi:uncharacterized protein YjbJ (UPF0337 family)
VAAAGTVAAIRAQQDHASGFRLQAFAGPTHRTFPCSSLAAALWNPPARETLPYRQPVKPDLETSMDKDRVAGAAKQAKGRLKDAAGKITGDEKLRAEGKADKVEGKVQNAVGGLKDKVREALDET